MLYYARTALGHAIMKMEPAAVNVTASLHRLLMGIPDLVLTLWKFECHGYTNIVIIMPSNIDA